jgi:hypothetical protein
MENEATVGFLCDGVYMYKGMYDTIFVCISCFQQTIGKLVQYKRTTADIFESTGVSYFLNQYYEDDVKSLFLNPENYECIGKIGKNFEFSADDSKMFLIRK